jgi:acetyl-CoA acetyltransferase
VCAERLGIGREAQDEHAVASVERARRAMAQGWVDWEVVPVEAPGKGGATTVVKEVRCVRADGVKPLDRCTRQLSNSL